MPGARGPSLDVTFQPTRAHVRGLRARARCSGQRACTCARTAGLANFSSGPPPSCRSNRSPTPRGPRSR
eukprot:2710902-Alexandrium_andersonii.AAC.1